MTADLFPIDLALVMVTIRTDRSIDAAVLAAHESIKCSASHARRCIGQQFRRARESVEGVNHGE